MYIQSLLVFLFSECASFSCVYKLKKKNYLKEAQITKRRNPCLPAYINLKPEQCFRVPLFFPSFSLSLLRNPLGYVYCEDNRHVIYGKKETAYCIEGPRVISTSGWKSRKFARRKLTFTKAASPCVTFHPLTWTYDIPLFIAPTKKKKKKRREKVYDILK